MSVPRRAESPTDADIQAAYAATLVDEWVRSGMVHAVVCPGSRSTPLALALARHPGVAVHIRLDERSAAFTALGIGAATGRPAVVLTTSGTAAAELHAAVVEADLGGVPLIACTADRPAELHDVGAPQTIDQVHLFGRSPRWFADPGPPSAASRPTWRSLASRCVAEALDGPSGPGPVHLNLAFREPLLGDAERGGVDPGRPGGAAWHQVVGVPPGSAVLPPSVAADLAAERGLVIAGHGCGQGEAVLALADALGWPVLADPRSGLRDRAPATVAAAEGILRSEQFAVGHRPEVVLHLGSPWVSKVLTEFVRTSRSEGARSIAVDPFGRWSDPEHEVSTFVRCDPTQFCRAALGGAQQAPAAGPSDRAATDRDRWRREWERAEARSQAALSGALDAGPLDEPALARRLVAALPGHATLVVSSSMPVRDVELFAAPRPGFPRVVANRGANGIDGVVSTALGVALGSEGPTVALVGDLAFLHDVSALVGRPGFSTALTVVVADNGGGGIFSFLPPATALDPTTFETLFGTPQAPDVAAVAAGFGWPVDDVDDDGVRFEVALAGRLAAGGLSVIRVRLPGREANVDAHRRLNQLVVDAVEAPDGE